MVLVVLVVLSRCGPALISLPVFEELLLNGSAVSLIRKSIKCRSCQTLRGECARTRVRVCLRVPVCVCLHVRVRVMDGF